MFASINNRLLEKKINIQDIIKKKNELANTNKDLNDLNNKFSENIILKDTFKRPRFIKYNTQPKFFPAKNEKYNKPNVVKDSIMHKIQTHNLPTNNTYSYQNNINNLNNYNNLNVNNNYVRIDENPNKNYFNLQKSNYFNSSLKNTHNNYNGNSLSNTYSQMNNVNVNQRLTNSTVVRRILRKSDGTEIELDVNDDINKYL